jgi:hypothetical protein
MFQNWGNTQQHKPANKPWPIAFKREKGMKGFFFNRPLL